jgi:hypothetical protein
MDVTSKVKFCAGQTPEIDGFTTLTKKKRNRLPDLMIYRPTGTADQGHALRRPLYN